jgi:hypothetical protein
MSDERARAPDRSAPLYVGTRTPLGPTVHVEAPGAPRQRLRHTVRRAADGFDWGRRGPAATDLARAIVSDATGDAALAERLSAPFAFEVVGSLPPAGFWLSRRAVLDWVHARTAAPTAEPAAADAADAAVPAARRPVPV